jgi:uncharacterized protein YecE (DUF72 family)
MDFAYYAMPQVPQLANMIQATGSDLTFSVKAHKTLTHTVDPAQWEGQARIYREAIEPLLREKRLEKASFQILQEFGYTQENRRYLDALLTYFKDVPSAVEFRLADWYIPDDEYRAAAYFKNKEFLRKRGSLLLLHSMYQRMMAELPEPTKENAFDLLGYRYMVYAWTLKQGGFDE